MIAEEKKKKKITFLYYLLMAVLREGKANVSSQSTWIGCSSMQ